jgi:ligand-binding SRPBCC domain-containing protein
MLASRSTSTQMPDSPHDPVRETVTIRAPINICFALSTRIELVQRTLGMKLIDSGVAGVVTTGHITAESRVIWRGWKFGLLTEHHTLITTFDPPHDGIACFEDSQERGRFASFRHEHFFRQGNDETELEDRIHFTLPFGPVGRLAARFIVAPHIRKLARQRFAMIKQLAEGDGWREWLAHPPV